MIKYLCEDKYFTSLQDVWAEYSCWGEVYVEVIRNNRMIDTGVIVHGVFHGENGNIEFF